MHEETTQGQHTGTPPPTAGSVPPSRTFTEAVQTCMSNYATFTGRASRSEFWWFALFYMAAIWGSMLAGAAIVGADAATGLMVLVVVALLLPWLAVTVRRLHDANMSGWLVLIGLIPLGGIVLLILCAQQGTAGPNKFG